MNASDEEMNFQAKNKPQLKKVKEDPIRNLHKEQKEVDDLEFARRLQAYYSLKKLYRINDLSSFLGNIMKRKQYINNQLKTIAGPPDQKYPNQKNPGLTPQQPHPKSHMRTCLKGKSELLTLKNPINPLCLLIKTNSKLIYRKWFQPTGNRLHHPHFLVFFQ